MHIMHVQCLTCFASTFVPFCSTMSIIVLVLVSPRRGHLNGKKTHHEVQINLPGYRRYLCETDKPSHHPCRWYIRICYYALFVCAHWCFEWMRILLRLHWAFPPHESDHMISNNMSKKMHKCTNVDKAQRLTKPKWCYIRLFCLFVNAELAVWTKFSKSLWGPKGLWVSNLRILTVIRERVSGIISPWMIVAFCPFKNLLCNSHFFSTSFWLALPNSWWSFAAMRVMRVYLKQVETTDSSRALICHEGWILHGSTTG